MTLRNVWLTVSLTVPPLIGCGTAANTVWLTPDEGGKRVYGGVRTDLTCIETAARGTSGMWVGGEEVKDRKRQVGQLLFFTLDLPLSAIGDTLTLPYTLASECGLLGRRGIYEPTTHPKALDERAGAKALPSSEPPPGNALGSIAGNRFHSWTLSPRIDVPIDR